MDLNYRVDLYHGMHDLDLIHGRSQTVAMRCGYAGLHANTGLMPMALVLAGYVRKGVMHIWT